jgi:AcrR family transcriptional regulator
VLAAFGTLVLERGYDEITVRDIIEQANVGRSTFYEHFENKDDLLRRSLRHVFGVLAATIGTPAPLEHLEAILEHFRENRRLTRAMLRGSTRPLMARILAELIEERLASLPRSSDDAVPLIPLHMVAAQVAAAQLALVESWLNAKAPCSRTVLARAIHASTNAAVSALLSRS